MSRPPKATGADTRTSATSPLDEVLVDDETRAVKALLSQPPSVLYAPFTTAADERRVPADRH
jgi:hypothetical protein